MLIAHGKSPDKSPDKRGSLYNIARTFVKKGKKSSLKVNEVADLDIWINETEESI